MSQKQQVLATKLPEALTKQLDSVCAQFGLRKNFLIETAIKEKIEDILDAHDLGTAISEASGFHDWKTVKKEMKL